MPIPSVDEKLKNLKSILAQLGKVAVAFSGGTDSTLLLRVATEVAGANVVALTATSDTLAPDDLAEALALAKAMQVDHVLVPVDEMDDGRESTEEWKGRRGRLESNCKINALFQSRGGD